MGDEAEIESRRAPWFPGPDTPPDHGWLGLNDDELLFHIAALEPQHAMDTTLLEVVRSTRHFFIRQEAAKRIRNPELLKEHSGDRHIGQILVRGMTRREDAAYLEKLVQESRHVEVKKAAEAQLKLLPDLDAPE
jgi:hypothetical protein